MLPKNSRKSVPLEMLKNGDNWALRSRVNIVRLDQNVGNFKICLSMLNGRPYILHLNGNIVF